MSKNAGSMKQTFANGLSIPALGLGTWQSSPGVVGEAVSVAIDCGYRHIDCAAIYGNEKEIGVVLKKKIEEGVVKRDDLFVTSKLWNCKHAPELVRPALEKTLSDLQLDYLDLYLIHWPIATKSGDDLFPKDSDGNMIFDDIHYNVTWKEMEKAVDEGIVRSIGLSNFNSKQIDDVYENARVKPMMLQVECHPYLSQVKLIDHCRKKSIAFTAYSPIGSKERPWVKPDDPVLLDDPLVGELGKKYGKSPAQILIAWQLQRGNVVIPKSSNADRIKQNADVFDFELSHAEIKDLVALDKSFRYCFPKITTVDGKEVPRDLPSPFYPFSLEY